MSETNTNTPAVLSPAQISIRKMRAMLDDEGVKKQFANALGEASGPFIASVMEIYSGDSTLVTCDPKIVISECLKAAILKLPVIKSLGFAWVVPFKKKGVAIPQFQIGYKGYIQLAMRTGQYRTINNDAVYEGELKDQADKLTGKIDFNGKRTSDVIVGYFAHFELLNGFSKTLYMTKEDMTKWAAKYSKSYNTDNSIWKSEYDGMALKTVLRRLLSHWGFLSIEMANALESDDERNLTDDRNETVAEKGNKKTIDAEDVSYEDIINNQVKKEQEAEATNGPSY